MGATGRLERRGDRARARDARGVRELLRLRRARANQGPRGRHQRDPRRQPTARSSSRAAREATGLPIEMLSAEEEARLGYVAAVNTTTLTDGAVLEIGGGSMQLVEVARPARRRARLAAARRRAPDRGAASGYGPARKKDLERLRELRARGARATSRGSPRRASGWSGSAAPSATSRPRRRTPRRCRSTSASRGSC